MVFDGRGFAKRIEEDLKKSGRLVGKKMLMISEEPENVYVRLKKECGERLGVDVRVVEFSILNFKFSIKEFSGMMVQLPVKDKKILEEIPLDKDVDGLRQPSFAKASEGRGYSPAAVVAVEKILKEAERVGTIYFDIFLRTAVVGAKGTMGKALVNRLRNLGYVVKELDKGDDLNSLKDCDVVISAVGEPDLIGPKYLMKGCVAIDLGFPRGDFAKGCSSVAGFITPVPGGVGPVTIVSLFENLSLT